MTKPINTESIEKATGKAWDSWLADLDSLGALDMSHAGLAKMVGEIVAEKGTESPQWWAQGITVAYEQSRGKRIPGQLANGLFEVAVSKTITKSRDDLFSSVADWLDSRSDFDGQKSVNTRTSETPNRSNWRCGFADKSTFTASVEGNSDKSKLVLSHTAIPTKHEADAWRNYWRFVLDNFSE